MQDATPMDDDRQDGADATPPDGLSCRAVEYDGDSEGIPGPCLMGGFEPPPDWEEFVDCYRDEWRPYLEVARLWLLDQDPWPRSASDWVAGHYFEFSDGLCMFFSWRGFADFLQAVAGRREGYIEYY